MNAIATAVYDAQAGIARLAADGVNVQIELEQILVAFEHRQADAMERAERLRDRLVAESKQLLDAHQFEAAVMEKGKEFYHRDRKDRFFGEMTNVAELAQRNMDRATALGAAASHVSDLIEIFKNLRLKDDGLRDEKGLPAPGPTTETLYHLRHMKGGDPVLRLRATGKLTDDHVRSAREIEAVQRWVTTGMGLKIQRLPVKMDASDDPASSSLRSPAEHQEHMALLHAIVYVPWTHGTDHAGMRARTKTKAEATEAEQFMAIGADMVRELVEGDSLKEIAGRYQMRWAQALKRVTGALDRYAKVRGEFSREQSPGGTPAALASIRARRAERERR